MNSWIKKKKKKRLTFFQLSFFFSLPFIVRHLRIICSPVIFNSECGWTIPSKRYNPPGFNNRIPSLITLDAPHTYNNVHVKHLFFSKEGNLLQQRRQFYFLLQWLFHLDKKFFIKNNIVLVLIIQTIKKRCIYLIHARYIYIILF
jgi:hypothetical protein